MRRSSIALAATALGVLIGGAIVRRVRRFDLRDRVVLITGGGRGLGLALARAFGRKGARLFLTGRDASTLDAALEQLAALGFEADAFPCDVRDPLQVDTLVGVVRRRYGRIDVVVNNAGVIQVGPLDTLTLDDFTEAMETHFWGPLYLMAAVLPEMRGRREGRVVNVSSIGGIVPAPHLVPYDASKFALRGLSEAMRVEVAMDGVRVTTVCPGLMRTGSARNVKVKGKNREEYAWFLLSDALPLTSMNADRAARAIVRACERGSAHVVLTWQAKLAAMVHGIAPGLMTNVLSWVNRLLPAPGDAGTAATTGAASESRITQSWLTALDDRAARKNNETLPSFLDRRSHV